MFDLGPNFGCDDVIDDVIIEYSNAWKISVTPPLGFGQIFRRMVVRTKYVHLMTKYTPLIPTKG